MENTIFANASLTILKRLENLTSTESVILKDLETRKENALMNKDNANENIASLSEQINDSNKMIATLKSEGSKLLEILKNINAADYETIVGTLSLAFDPVNDSKKIENQLPEELESREQEINKLNEMLKTEKQNLSDAEDILSELVVRREEALRSQENLTKLLELAKKGEVNKTRDEVISVLESVEFNSSEAKVAAKLLLFPEEELIPYFSSSDNEKMEDLFQDALDKISGIEKKPTNQELQESLDKELDNEEAHENRMKNDTPVLEEVKEQSLAEVLNNEEEPKEDKQKVEKIENALEVFTAKEDEEKQEDIKIEETKVSFEEIESTLLELGKNKEDIELVELKNVDIANEVEKLKNVGLEPVRIPIIAYRYGVDKLVTNIETLSTYGYELDGSELEKCLATLILTDSETFKNNLEVLKNYKVNLKKSNGKLAIKVLSLETKKLISNLDLLIEVGEVDLVYSNPSVLIKNCNEIAENLLFCKANKIPYTEEKNGKVVYRSFVLSRKELNELVEKELDLHSVIIDDFALSDLIDINLYEKLADYNNTSDYGVKQTLNKDDATYFKYMNLINKLKKYINEEKSVYDLDGILCSVNNTNRNLMCLVNSDVSNEDDELLIAALLYNSYKDKDEMKKVIDIIKDNK